MSSCPCYGLEPLSYVCTIIVVLSTVIITFCNVTIVMCTLISLLVLVWTNIYRHFPKVSQKMSIFALLESDQISVDALEKCLKKWIFPGITQPFAVIVPNRFVLGFQLHRE